MKFEILDSKTNKPITNADFEKLVGKSDVSLEDLWVNKDGYTAVFVDDGSLNDLEDKGITIRPKRIKNLERIKSMGADELTKVFFDEDSTSPNLRCESCYFCNHDDCNGKCREGFRRWLDLEVDA